MPRTAIHPLKTPAAVGAFLARGLFLAYASSPARAATIVTVNCLAETAANEGKRTLGEAMTTANADEGGS